MTESRDAELHEQLLSEAFDAAARIEDELIARWAASGEPTRLELEHGTGAEDQPVFIFTLLLDLSDDFDAADWPGDRVEELSEEVRAAVAGSPVELWNWVVTARATATAE